jgi:hypothetical protein
MRLIIIGCTEISLPRASIEVKKTRVYKSTPHTSSWLTNSMELSTFYGIRKFNTEFTRALHLSLSWGRPIQTTPLHPTCTRSILILFTHLRLGLSSGLSPSGFPTNNLYAFLFTHSCYIHRPSHSPRLYYSDYTWRRVQIMKLYVFVV